jgi:ABC-2 type transport system ATP-binding protein
MLRIDKVKKTFSTGFFPKKVEALQDLSLSVARGDVFAFIGPNGAGKTTTIKLILGLISPDSGTISVNGLGHHDRNLRRHIGYLPDQPYFYDDLTAIEYIIFAGRLFGLNRRDLKARAEALADLVGLGGRADRRLRGFSRGMLQRVALAQALVHDPDLLILDEPLTGLDPIGRKEFRDIFLELKGQGKTIFFSSHILADAEMISDRVGILRQGNLVKELGLKDLHMQENDGVELVYRKNDGTKVAASDKPWQVVPFVHGGLINLTKEQSVARAVQWVEDTGGSVVSVTPRRKSLEDIFLEEVTGTELEQSGRKK